MVEDGERSRGELPDSAPEFLREACNGAATSHESRFAVVDVDAMPFDEFDFPVNGETTIERFECCCL